MTRPTHTDPPPDDRPAGGDLRCDRVRLLLSLALDGATTPPQQAEIDAHLPACPECRASAAVDRRVRERLSEPAAVPTGFRERVLAAATRRAREARAQNRFLMAGAAAAVLLAAAAFYLPRDTVAVRDTARSESVALQAGRNRARTVLITSLAAQRALDSTEESPR